MKTCNTALWPICARLVSSKHRRFLKSKQNVSLEKFNLKFENGINICWNYYKKVGQTIFYLFIMGLPVKSLRILQKPMFKKAYISKNKMSFLIILQHFQLKLHLICQDWSVFKLVLTGFLPKWNSYLKKKYWFEKFGIK